MSFKGKCRLDRRLAVSILATLMVGLMTACGEQSAGTGVGESGTVGFRCPTGHEQHTVHQAQAQVKDANGQLICKEIQGPPIVTNADLDATNGNNGGETAAGAAGQPSISDPEPNLEPDSKPDSTPNPPPALQVKLDKPTEPAVAYTDKNGAKLVALTFDDGPDNRYTPKLLDILKAKKIHATFFTVGVQVKQYGSVMKRIVKEGSEIGNHSYTHADLSKLDSTHILNQIKWTDTLIRKQAGYVPRLVRAPYGASSPQLKQIINDNKRTLVFWTVDTRDWEGSTVTAMRANVGKNTHPGGIILMHSFGSKHIANTVQLLPLIIKDLQAKGYTFVTVSELLDAKAKHKAAATK